MSQPYPVRVRGRLDPDLSRGLWLVKWLLLVPHLVVLLFLWIAFAVLSVVAFFAVLFTARYPQGIFDFNVGVLRWSWRVGFYGYGALGTDRYPPFTLREVPDYPAGLEVDHAPRLSRGLVLVKFWLLAIPHYLVLSFFVGGAVQIGHGEAAGDWSGGLIALLVFIAAVVLLFTGSYPRTIFDLVMGLNRWVFRVVGYAALMTDDYPPFRLDLGEDDPGEVDSPPYPAQPEASGSSVTEPQQYAGITWTAGRIVALGFATLAILVSLGAGIGGAALAFVDSEVRDDQGYLMSGTEQLSASSYAISTDNVQLHGDGGAASLPRAFLGKVRITAEGAAGKQLFIGIGRTDDVNRYLAGTEHAVLVGLDGHGDGLQPRYRYVEGAAPTALPEGAGVWAAQASGSGEQSLFWEAESGDWTVVVMNADGSAPVDARVAAGATVPGLGWVVAVLLTLAGVLLLVGLTLVVVAVRRPRSS